MHVPNLPKLFLQSFKWLLLVLAGLSINKAAEGLVRRATTYHNPFFYEPTIFVGPYRLPFCVTTADIDYLVGVAEILVIMMLLFRYFLCLPEPITQACRENGRFETSKINQVSGHWIVMVLIVSICEFILIAGAVHAIPNTNQWLVFLALLAGFDFVFFVLLIPVCWLLLWIALQLLLIRSLFGDGWGPTKNAVKDAYSGKAPAVHNSVVLSDFSRSLIVQLQKLGIARDNWRSLYWKWDGLDLLVAGVGLVACVLCQLPDWITVAVVFVLTLIISIWNVYSNKEAYLENIQLLNL